MRVLDYSSAISRVRNITARRSFWVFLDQGIASGGNFLTAMVVARNLQPVERVGDFGLFMQVIFYVNALQAALIVYPLTVKGAARDSAGLREMGNQSLAFTAVLFPLVLLAVGLSAAVMKQSMILTLLVGVAVAAWQLQETSRRTLLAHLRYGEALVGDALRYLGQAAVVWGAARLGMLSLEVVFGAMLGASVVGGVVQALQVGLRRWTSDLRQAGAEFWSLGRWNLGAAALGVITNLAFPFTLKLSHANGDKLVAMYTAFGSLFTFVNPITVSMVGLILPACSRAAASDGLKAARRLAVRYGLLGLTVIGPFFVMVFVFPQFSARIMLKQPEYQEYAWALRLCVAAVAWLYFGAMVEAFLNSLQKAHLNFVAYLTNTLAVLLVGLPMTVWDGLRGALAGGILCVALRVVAMLVFVNRLGFSSTEAPISESVGRQQAELDVMNEHPIMSGK